MAANRLVRWAITLSAFDFDLEHQPGKLNGPADALSRLPIATVGEEEEERDGEQYGLHMFNIRLEDLQLSKRLLQKKTDLDDEIGKIVRFVTQGWPEDKHTVPKELLSYYEKRLELSFEEKILLWGGRLVIPRSLRKAVLSVLHEGHPGITGVRAVARCHVWWPLIDKDIEIHVQHCKSCQSARPNNSEVPLFSWTTPDIPWTRLHVDYCGPFQG